MSSRPITNLDRILASVSLKDDEVVLTPEPLMGTSQRPIFDFNLIPPPTESESQEDTKGEDGFYTASQGTTDSKLSSESNSSEDAYSLQEDVPLTVELMTPGTQVRTLAGTRNVWNTHPEPRRKRLVKRHQHSRSSRVPNKKIGFPVDASSNSVFQYDSTSDGLDAYEEREQNKKRKTKKRQGGNERGNGEETKN